MFSNNRIHIAAAALALVAAIVVSCTGTADTEEALAVVVPSPTVPYGSDSQFIRITASGEWTLTVQCGGETSWAYFSGSDKTRKAGSGDANVVLNWDANTAQTARKAVLLLERGSRRETAELVQNPKQADPIGGDLVSEPVRNWMELPAMADDGRYFITHDMSLSGVKVRNYSFYLDTDAKIAVWVAYPLNKGLISSGSGRTNDWSLDPKVPVAYQVNVSSHSFSGYQRGHQLPSADRYANGANEQTFYGTNVTPQLKALNENAWASLEGYVRDWSKKLDTLYVVTGADISRSTSTVYDNDGKRIAVPNGYFKALLGYKKNAQELGSGQVSGYIGIGFYFEHKGYDASQIMSQSMTLDALEAKLGYDFFVNLPAKIGSSAAAQVESTKTSWWR